MVAQEQRPPSLTPAGPNRPSDVPADYVITPFGYFHPSCVLQLKKGESISKEGMLRHADGSEAKVNACQYSHFRPSGSPASGQASSQQSAITPESGSAEPPAIGHSWIENAGVITSSAYGKEVSTWTVPPIPLMHDGQTIFIFPGFQDAGDGNTSILQPVIGSYDGGPWSMASWNCCLAGTADESNVVAINPGDTIVGTSEMTCAGGSTTCATWNVITEDQTTNQSTELTATPSDGQTFNWAFGGVLEVYNLDQCLDYPPNASVTINNLLYDYNMNEIASPGWVGSGGPASSVQPQCDYGVTTTATETTLTYGTSAPSFGLGISPANGIAVNQGSSANGTLTATDINGFNGSVGISAGMPPNGITTLLSQGASPNTYVLKLSAASTATLTGANPPAFLTLTAAGPGISTQTIPMNVIVNPPLTGGVGTMVNLTDAYNVHAFFNDSAGYPTLNPTNSLDGSGDAYSANQLNPEGLSPMALDLSGVQFNFGVPNQVNAVYGTGTNPISLPNASFDVLQILGTGFGGSQKAQTITVTYTDNTTQSFTQTFDDWGAGPTCTSPTQCTPGESVAVTMPYADTEYAYSRADSIYYLFGYSFALNAAKTVKSLALPNNRNVLVLAATLTNITAAPTFSPAAGTITSPQSVNIADSTAGATIYYTTDGSAPTTSSAVYSSAITVASTETLQALAIASGDAQSAIASATYTLSPPAATPVFMPGTGTYSSPQTVTIADSTPGATIYYTTDGSAPSSSSAVYKSPIAVSSTETLNAIASASNYSASAVADAMYTVPPNFSVTGTAITLAPGATTGNTSTISLTPWGGFTGVVSLSCTLSPAAASDPATCSIPASATISGATAQTVLLTVNTTSATSSLNRPGTFPWGSVGGTALACMFLFGMPARRRKWTSNLLALLMCLFVLGGALGCSGNGGGAGSGVGNPGTTPGAYVVTVTGTSGTITQSGTISISLQ
ncbi:MAG: chitobiase/beta-hexosaminidase C-terminal domain-containing protein [Acidobacteriaceae bacterium]